MTDAEIDSRDIVAAVLGTHRWKTMGVRSVECECGTIIVSSEEAALREFPADLAFRWHIADAILEAIR